MNLNEDDTWLLISFYTYVLHLFYYLQSVKLKSIATCELCRLAGFARVENVEFFHTGQEGWVALYDPRYSLVFLSLGEDPVSYVRRCSFHHGFASAIGVLDTHQMEVSHNVIHHTVGSGTHPANSPPANPPPANPPPPLTHPPLTHPPLTHPPLTHPPANPPPANPPPANPPPR